MNFFKRFIRKEPGQWERIKPSLNVGDEEKVTMSLTKGKASVSEAKRQSSHWDCLYCLLTWNSSS